MLGDAVGDAGLQVRGRADLQGDAPVEHVLGQFAEHPLARAAGDVLDEPDAVPDPGRPAELHRLPDGRRAEGLAGVNGELDVVPPQVLEDGREPAGREAVLGAGDVEAGHRVAPVGDRQFGHAQRGVAVPHRRHQLLHHDRTPRGRAGRHPLGQAVAHRLDRLRHGQPAAQVLLGRPAGLGVDHAVRGLILDELPRHPLQLRVRLHYRDGVLEGLQVAHQRPGVGRLEEPVGQGAGVVRGQLMIDLRSQFQHGGRAQPAVQMVVQGDLRQGLQNLVIDAHLNLSSGS